MLVNPEGPRPPAADAHVPSLMFNSSDGLNRQVACSVYFFYYSSLTVVRAGIKNFANYRRQPITPRWATFLTCSVG